MHNNVMIVDDSKVSRMIIKKIVSEIAPDATLIEAANSDEALEKLASNDIDAVVVDFHMPGLNGLELAEKLKELRPTLDVTMLTANIQKEIKERADALGVGYLTKPPKKDELQEFLAG